MRSVERFKSSSIPMALRVLDGFIIPEPHADPLDTEISNLSSLANKILDYFLGRKHLQDQVVLIPRFH